MITELSDDILICVLSLLTLKEAGRTSVLSKRWRYIWAYIPVLNFDYPWEISERTRPQGRYLRWVNQVVNSHKALIIDEFRVRFDLGLLRRINGSFNNIDNWLRFAMEKRVKMLELDFSWSNHGYARYVFPELSWCNSLTSLKLACVDITDETLESFLCNCQSLEYLSVKYSNSLVHLKVSGPSLHLKHLIIFRCRRMKDLEISAPNLVFFSYFGEKIRVQFENTPKLAEVRFGANELMNMCCNLSRYVSTIKVLSLDSWTPLMLRILSVDLFARLEKLDTLACANWIDAADLYSFGSLLTACSSLQHYKIRLINTYDEEPLDSLPRKRRGHYKQNVCPHDHMKIVEIVGFVGYRVDLEYAMYLMDRFTSLDKIILDTRDVIGMGTPRQLVDTTARRKSRELAELLRANLNPRTKLEII